MQNVKSIFAGIRLWAINKNLLMGSTWQKQWGKLEEEIKEAKVALESGDLAAIKDELGDCAVVLTVIAAQHGLNLEDCLEAALLKISKRKGKMVDGVFVKDGY